MADLNLLFKKRIAIVGAGNIGRILIERLLASGALADSLAVCDGDKERVTQVTTQYGVLAAALDNPAICSADMLLLAPSPKAVPQILAQIKDRFKPGQVVVSFAAAVPIARLEALVPQGVSVVRVMPNAPSLIGQGINPVAYSTSISPQARESVIALLAILGKTIEVRDDQMNWCVGLSGAAMRSLLPALEGMTQAGIEAGLSEPDARKIAAQVMQGTASLVLQTDLGYEEIKSLTPMETLDEGALAQFYVDTIRNAKKKIDGLQQKLEAI